MARTQTIPIDHDDSADFALETISFDRANTQMTDSAVFRPDLHEIIVDDDTRVGPHHWKDIRDQVMASFNPYALPCVKGLGPTARGMLDILMNRQASAGVGVSLNSSGSFLGGAQASMGGGDATAGGGVQANMGGGDATAGGGVQASIGGGDATTGGGVQANIGESDATAAGASGVQRNPTPVVGEGEMSIFGAGRDE